MNTIIHHTKLDAVTAVQNLQNFIGRTQLAVIGDMCCSEERQFFINKLCELGELVTTMPSTYQTDVQGDQAIAHLHYFLHGADWYIVERDCETEQLQVFGKANLGYGAELGYISIEEILECGAELDLHWIPKKLADI